MTSSDVITPGDEHRDEVVGLMRVAFNMGSAALAEREAWPARTTSDSGGAGASSR